SVGVPDYFRAAHSSAPGCACRRRWALICNAVGVRTWPLVTPKGVTQQSPVSPTGARWERSETKLNHDRLGSDCCVAPTALVSPFRAAPRPFEHSAVTIQAAGTSR